MSRYAYIMAGTKPDEMTVSARRRIMGRIGRIELGVVASSQKGSALILALLILVVLTVIGITGANQALLQERMAGNTKQQTDAFFAAESGVAELAAWYEENEWPSTANDPVPDTAGNLGKADHLSFNWELVDGFDWTDEEIRVDVTGRFASPGNETISERTIRVELVRESGDPFADGAPAAITCDGGACNIQSGAGAPAFIDGRDHASPGETGCENQDCLMLSEQGDIAHELAKPAIYLSEADGSDISEQGAGGSKDPFCGALHPADPDDLPNDVPSGSWDSDPVNDYYCGDGEDAPGIVTDSDYQDMGMDPPNTDSILGDSGPGSIDADSGFDSTFGDVDNPKVTYIGFNDGTVRIDDGSAGIIVVDGGEAVLDLRGGDVFEGLIILKNGGKLDSRGNPDIYGSVIVDSSGLSEAQSLDYEPFVGRGRPSIHYSTAALERAGQAWGGAGVGRLNSWAQRN